MLWSTTFSTSIIVLHRRPLLPCHRMWNVIRQQKEKEKCEEVAFLERLQGGVSPLSETRGKLVGSIVTILEWVWNDPLWGGSSKKLFSVFTDSSWIHYTVDIATGGKSKDIGWSPFIRWLWFDTCCWHRWSCHLCVICYVFKLYFVLKDFIFFNIKAVPVLLKQTWAGMAMQPGYYL